MENTKEKEQEQTDRGLNQKLGLKEAKQETSQSVAQHKSSSNKLSATLHKMFHTDGQKASDTESEKSETSSVLSANDHSGISKPRFQKINGGSHIHNLLPCKRGHRMHNFFKELGIHGKGEVQQSQTTVNDKLQAPSLSEKYGKPQEVIGRGSFGIVRIAHKTEPKVSGEKLFAVKEFKKRSNEPAKKYIKRLTSEFCISSSLHHINIIDTLDLLQDTQGNYCEVMEYCPGGDLYSLIVASGGFELEEGNCFFGQLINGVKYMHDNGVAHRDLKPENLIFTSTGCLKITDFGNAECFRTAWETEPHMSRGICGSEPYIAPEEFKVESFDPRCVDVWACGIIYMSMITGRLLWRVAKEKEDGNFKAFLEAKAKGSVLAPFQCLINGQREIILRVIEPNPKHRITTEQIIAHPWFSSIHICHRQPPSTNNSSASSTSCVINAVDQQASSISRTSIENIA